MSRNIHRLKDSELRAALGKSKTLHDGGGLYFQSTEGGAASFHYRYQIGKRTTKMGLGPYPSISLADARDSHKHYQRLKALGQDPLKVRDAERASARRSYRSIQTIFEEFFAIYKRQLKGEGEAGRWWSPVKNHVLPSLGEDTVETLTVDRVISTFEPIWTTKKDTARKAFNRLRMALEFARADEPFDLQILADATSKLGPQGKRKRVSARALHWKEWPPVYADLTASMTHTALKLMVLTVVRTANIRFMRWEQIDRRAAVWTLNENDTKSEQPFRVPLQPQAMMLLRRAEKWRHKSGFVFPVPRNKQGVLSNNAFLQYFNKHNIDTTGHGIRSTVTDFLLENDVADQDLADMALAHQTKKEVTKAYYRSDMLEKRREVMQVWADYVTQDERVRQIAHEQDQALNRYARALEGMEPETLERVEAGLPAFDVDKWYREEAVLEDDIEQI
ncbi:tyrosine-type recombinase/integrase [Ruegeria arenilitoris]|uniref:tyrosine-type recombinase/integrase n=1 Tax=Ruegeria arenilitoris TaxID=1173585 RepID=UPI00147BEB93|nr:site-specific integrase [Ruegeria arenilitoris]